ncbi:MULTISPECIES: lipopolysaccharide biosynthesis protein [unclassified Sphingobacterium]|uniref:lipopolysaccharide biosynthesis protein n=1 Tax=unclassified Sphingobacterium TaxID=2609468 RepID=UPI0025EFDBB5|nr:MULTISPECIES: lipopolysaccharide biosynthesis protein [unclassified Sphingobacterium]
MLGKITKSKTIKSLFWVALEKFGYSGIYFISTLVLARLLTPTDFGIIGVLAIFISFSQMIVESGLGGALVKKDVVTREDYNTIFTFNIVCAIVIYCILFGLSSKIASFYGKQILSPITKVIGLNIIISAFTLTQRVNLIRKLDFRKQSVISISALIVAVFFSVLLAINGYGVWALVWQQVFYNFFYFLFIFFIVRYKPSLSFNKESFLSMYAFGGKIFLSSLLTVLYNEGISSIIAKVHNLVMTGFYYQAKKLVDFPVNIFRAFGDNVVFPMLSKVNNIDFGSKASQLMKVILIISLPGFIVLYFYSTEIVYIVLGPQWSNSVKMLDVLILSSVAFIIDGVSKNILKATGNGSAILKSEFFKRLIGIVLILIFIKYELLIFLYSIVIGNFFGCFINMYYVNKETSYSFKNQLFDILPVIIISILAGVIGYKLSYLLQLSSTLHLLLGSVIIGIMYLGAIALFYRKIVSFKSLSNNIK